jgi:hypothetical protein
VPRLWPRCQLDRDGYVALLDLELRVYVLQTMCWRDLASFYRHSGLNHARDAADPFRVADICLHRADHERGMEPFALEYPR